MLFFQVLFLWNFSRLWKYIMRNSHYSVRLFATPWTAPHQASLSITTSWNLHKLLSVESVMPSNHISLCLSLLLPPSIFPSIRVFSNESVLCIRWPKYWDFNLQHQSFQLIWNISKAFFCFSWYCCSWRQQSHFSRKAFLSNNSSQSFPGGWNSKDCSMGDLGLIPGSGRIPWRRAWLPSQYSCLENLTDRGAWQGYSPWGRKELDMAECLILWFSPSWPGHYTSVRRASQVVTSGGTQGPSASLC